MLWSSTNRFVLKWHGKTSLRSDEVGMSPISSLEFVYPFGASLNVQPPAVPVLSTGSTCLPCQRSVCAFYTSPAKVRTVGRESCRTCIVLCVCTEWRPIMCDWFDDALSRQLSRQGTQSKITGKSVHFRSTETTWLSFKDVVMEFLTNSSFRLNEIDAEVPDVSRLLIDRSTSFSFGSLRADRSLTSHCHPIWLLCQRCSNVVYMMSKNCRKMCENYSTHSYIIWIWRWFLKWFGKKAPTFLALSLSLTNRIDPLQSLWRSSDQARNINIDQTTIRGSYATTKTGCLSTYLSWLRATGSGVIRLGRLLCLGNITSQSIDQ